MPDLIHLWLEHSFNVSLATHNANKKRLDIEKYVTHLGATHFLLDIIIRGHKHPKIEKGKFVEWAFHRKTLGPDKNLYLEVEQGVKEEQLQPGSSLTQSSTEPSFFLISLLSFTRSTGCLFALILSYETPQDFLLDPRRTSLQFMCEHWQTASHLQSLWSWDLFLENNLHRRQSQTY